MTPMIIVLSSPSGGGKSTITRRVLAARRDCGYSVSVTTRAPRPGEVDGSAYHFVSEAGFDRMLANHEFLEHATYNGHRYGTLADELVQITHGGRHALLDIEIEGARQVRIRFPSAVLIFIVPPSGAILAERLRARANEDGADVSGRLARAVDELFAAAEYDYIVVNDLLDDAVRDVSSIIDAESLRTGRQRDVSVVLERLRTEVMAELSRMQEPKEEY